MESASCGLFAGFPSTIQRDVILANFTGA